MIAGINAKNFVKKSAKKEVILNFVIAIIPQLIPHLRNRFLVIQKKIAGMKLVAMKSAKKPKVVFLVFVIVTTTHHFIMKSSKLSMITTIWNQKNQIAQIFAKKPVKVSPFVIVNIPHLWN